MFERGSAGRPAQTTVSRSTNARNPSTCQTEVRGLVARIRPLRGSGDYQRSERLQLEVQTSVGRRRAVDDSRAVIAGSVQSGPGSLERTAHFVLEGSVNDDVREHGAASPHPAGLTHLAWYHAAILEIPLHADPEDLRIRSACHSPRQRAYQGQRRRLMWPAPSGLLRLMTKSAQREHHVENESAIPCPHSNAVRRK